MVLRIFNIYILFLHSAMIHKPSYIKINRYHGFCVYFDLSKEQITEVAVISNTNIAFFNDAFYRMIEDTIFTLQRLL